jgi:hypothetical protein
MRREIARTQQPLLLGGDAHEGERALVAAARRHQFAVSMSVAVPEALSIAPLKMLSPVSTGPLKVPT